MTPIRGLGQALTRASPSGGHGISTASRPLCAAVTTYPTPSISSISQQAVRRRDHIHTQSRGALSTARANRNATTTTTSVPFASRGFFSQLSSLRRREEEPDKLDGSDISIDRGTSSPTKAALNKAMHDAASREESGSGSSGKDSSGGNNKAAQSARQGSTQQLEGRDQGSEDTVPHLTPDMVAEGDARGRTGGGKALGSTSENAPPQPKIFNASVSGSGDMKLTKEQKREVDQHNKEFENTYDHSERAPDDKVDKKFWSEQRQSD